MDNREYELMREYLKGDLKVYDMIVLIDELERKVDELVKIVWSAEGEMNR